MAHHANQGIAHVADDLADYEPALASVDCTPRPRRKDRGQPVLTAARFVGGPLDGQWRNVAGATFQVRQDGPDHVVRYRHSHDVWHDEENEVLSHMVYRFVERREGRLR